MKGVTIVNSTNQDISMCKPYFEEFANTGKIHEDIADIFDLKKYVPETPNYDGEVLRIIVDFKEDE